MRSHSVIHLARIAVLFLFVTVIASVAIAQPPPIGPDSYKVDKTDIGALILRNFVRTQIDQVLATTNTALKNQGHGNINVSRQGDVTFSAPYRLASLNPNSPNQYYVHLPMNFTVNVSIPYTSDRQLYYPLDLNVSCDGWYTGNGTLGVRAVVGPPDIQGGNVVENLLVRDTINNYIKSKLPAIGAISQSLPGKCVTIGASPSNVEAQNSFIAWDEPGRSIVNTGLVGPHLEITFEKLKRLAARGNGQLLYSTVENVQLDAYVNFAERQSQTLTFKEGDVVNLNIQPVIIKAPLPNILVIIGSINQPGGSQDDTTFASALKTANFAPGEHTIQIPKTYVIPGGGPSHAKPSFGHTPGYELTYKVASFNPGVISQPVTTTKPAKIN